MKSGPFLLSVTASLLVTIMVGAQARSAPVYLQPSSLFPSGDYSSELLERKTVSVRLQKWFRIKLSSRQYAWVPEDIVLSHDGLRGEAFTKNPTAFRSSPLVRANTLINLSAGVHLTPIASNSEIVPRDWIKVQILGQLGYVEAKDLLLGRTLKEKDLILTESDRPLRSAPLPDADVVDQSRRGSVFHYTETAVQKWGRVVIKERGELWWPLNQDGPTPGLRNPKIKTAELFMNHKIHDIASSPVLPNLKILSAQGVFRTIDGDEWEKLPQFEDRNYAVAIAESGRIFVGAEYSDDHGETFHSFIRLESLISSLRSRWKTNPKRLKILEIASTNPDGHHLKLKVDIGLNFPVQVTTSDQGGSWAAL